jgi:hypothetical protein
MADEYEREPGDTPGRFINKVAAGVRSDLEQGYMERLVQARKEMREEQDLADARFICERDDAMAQRMAEYRRGRWFHLGGIAASAASGFSAGFLAQRQADFRPGGVPLMAVAGLPGVVTGAALDEDMATRAFFVVGGTMFSVGATTYTLLNPRLKDGEAP